LDTSYFDDFTNPEHLALYKDVLAHHRQEANNEDLADMPPRSAFVGFTFRHSDWQEKILK
jgi:hypothetical protein